MDNVRIFNISTTHDRPPVWALFIEGVLRLYELHTVVLCTFGPGCQRLSLFRLIYLISRFIAVAFRSSVTSPDLLINPVLIVILDSTLHRSELNARSTSLCVGHSLSCYIVVDVGLT